MRIFELLEQTKYITGGIKTISGIMPDGDITYGSHYGDRENERAMDGRVIAQMLADAVKKYRDEIIAEKDVSFVIKRRQGGMGIGIVKVERPDGSMKYTIKTAYPKDMRVGPDQTVYWL